MSKVNGMNFVDADSMDISEVHLTQRIGVPVVGVTADDMDISEVHLTHRMTKEEIDSFLNPDKH